uniref:Uncharacterized protein n=1 Tax=Anguilla anguilla TaxID=7936 RepID=A0A0E9V1E6_ANGAN
MNQSTLWDYVRRGKPNRSSHNISWA